MNCIDSKDKFCIMVEHSIVGSYIMVDGKITHANQFLSEMFGYAKDEIIGMNPLDLTHEDDKGRVQKHMMASLESENNKVEYSAKCVTRDGEVKYLYVYGVVVEIDKQISIIGSVIDETEKTLANMKLERLANYDSLTNLFNRYYFNIYFEHSMKQAQRYEKKLALLLFDIDNFKRINDSLGHKAGDVVLVRTAELIGEVLRESDSFFRIGGDEFTIIVENFSSVNEVKILTKRIQQALRTSIEVDNLSFHISLSIGVALYPEHGNCIQTLQKSADIAMYQAKKDGKNRFSIFAQESGSSSKILELEDEFYEGIQKGELETYLQPQIDLSTKKLVGAEALVRWRHPKRGILTPNVFLPLAQEMGLLYKLDLIMIEDVYKLLKKYDAWGVLNFTISVNISNALFHHQRFFSIMQKFQQKYTYLCKHMQLELTEDILMVDNNHANKIIKSLKLIGYKMAIDDFGTGFSSLSNLKMMDIDELKIDRAFIKDITTDKNDKAIVQAILAMGHTLDLKVLAEGVEDASQIIVLKNIGCDVVQGYYYNRPMPVKEFDKKWIL